MRFIPVADAARSILFYRKILGFEVGDERGVVEAVLGPARIQFNAQDRVPGDDAGARSRRSVILFFETDDVEAMHAAIRARGGEPSEIEKVNWIKMRMFEIRDPDGHALWFGQSYDKPHTRGPSPQLRKALPELPFRDVAAAVVHYRDVLGFRINHQQHDLGVMDRDDITVLLIARTPRSSHRDRLRLCLRRRCGCALCGAEGEGRNRRGRAGKPSVGPSRLRGDRPIEGNRIRFGQPFE